MAKRFGKMPCKGCPWADYCGYKVNDEASWPPPCARRAMAERDEARKALEWCAEQVFEGCDIDGGGFQDEMVKRGIMVSEPAPDDYKAEWDADEWFVLAWKAIQKARAKSTTENARGEGDAVALV